MKKENTYTTADEYTKKDRKKPSNFLSSKIPSRRKLCNSMSENFLYPQDT